MYHTDNGSVTWTFSENNTLTVSGSGTVTEVPSFMENWSANVRTLWFDEGITVIGCGDLGWSLNGLEDLYLPASLLAIGDGVFPDYIGLSAVHYAGTTGEISSIAIGSDNGALDEVLWNCSDSELGPLNGRNADGLLWEFTENRELIISYDGQGNGQLTDSSDWRPFMRQIRRVIIGEGITGIRCDFSRSNGSWKFTEIMLPSSLETIDGTFDSCSSLTTVRFQNNSNLKRIGAVLLGPAG